MTLTGSAGRWSARAALAACVFALSLHALAEPPASAEDTRSALRSLPWQNGPTTGTLGDKSTVGVPKDSAFLPESEGSKFLTLTGNLPSAGTSILFGPSWWATFDFNPVGYVKDDEKIDADALLKSIKEADGPSNQERRRLGIAELHTEGWHVPPHYDPDTKHLEWALRFSSPGETRPIINYTVRLLGRSGVENVTLVSTAETMDGDVRQLKDVLKTFSFKSGERYAEFKPGDHVAEFGLGALIAGGAAAVAVKSGFWKVIVAFFAAFWKAIAVGAVAVSAAVGKLFKKKPQA